MDRYLPKEKENRKIGMGISIGVHLLLFILFMLFAAYKPPYPPNPGIPGVELNFGLTDAGQGDVQTESKVITDNTEDAKPEESAAEEITEPVEETTPSPTEAEPENVVTSPVETPHLVEPKPEVTPVNKPVEKVEKPKTVNPNAVMKDYKKDGGESKEGTKSEATSSSNGDKNVKGDQGDKSGSVDARALYGTPGDGGGNGKKLNLDGWQWENEPNERDPSNETGFIVFEFQVDDYGTVLWSRAIKWTVSPSVVNFYKSQLEKKASFKPTGSNIVNYRGTVRFEITAK